MFSRLLLQEDGAAVLVQQQRSDAPRLAVGLTEEAHALLPEPLVGRADVIRTQRQDRRPVGAADQGGIRFECAPQQPSG